MTHLDCLYIQMAFLFNVFPETMKDKIKGLFYATGQEIENIKSKDFSLPVGYSTWNFLHYFRTILIIKQLLPMETLYYLGRAHGVRCWWKFRFNKNFRSQMYICEDVPSLGHSNPPWEDHSSYYMLCCINQITRHSKEWSTDFEHFATLIRFLMNKQIANLWGNYSLLEDSL